MLGEEQDGELDKTISVASGRHVRTLLGSSLSPGGMCVPCSV